MSILGAVDRAESNTKEGLSRSKMIVHWREYVDWWQVLDKAKAGENLELVGRVTSAVCEISPSE